MMKSPLPNHSVNIIIKPFISESGTCKITPTRELLIFQKSMDSISILQGSEWANLILLFPYKSATHPSTNVPGLEDGKEGDYLTDTLTDRAISFIKDHQDQPFFINFWYYTVHTPIQPKKSKLAKYQKKLRHWVIPTDTRMVFLYGAVLPARDRTHPSMPAWWKVWMRISGES